jgi:hypothetical protein
MKKKQNKLGVAKDTIRTLMAVELQEVAGGVNPSGQGNSCVRSCPTDQTSQQRM